MIVIVPVQITDAMTPQGPELLVDPTFISPIETNWFTTAAAWTIASNAATHVAGIFQEMTQPAAWVEDEVHTFGLTVANLTSGAVTFGLGTFNLGSTTGQITANGTYTFRNMVGDTGGNSRFEPTVSSFDGDVSALSLTKDFSNVTEDDAVEWSAGSYSLGTERMVAVDTPDIHLVFESLVNSNTTNPVDDQPPPLGTGTGANWLNLGATNRWAMFDDVVGTQTTNAEKIEVIITPGALINSVSLLNVSALTAQVIVEDPTDGIVYDETKNLISTSGISDWWAYYFTPISETNDVIFLDLPSYSTATITIIISQPSGTAACGVCVLGPQTMIGRAQWGTSIGIIDYSVKTTDAFGNFVITPRSFSKRADYSVAFNTAQVASVQTFLSSITTTPVVWVGDEDYGSTLIYGYYRDFDIELSSPTISLGSIEVEGLS